LQILSEGGKGGFTAVAGKRQLMRALKARGIRYPPLPVIGLGKVMRKSICPAGKPWFGRHRPALRLLQAIRDEAHRFAVNYHRDMRGKRIRGVSA